MKKIILFLCSYAPLIIIVAINFIPFISIEKSGIIISPIWQMTLLSLVIIVATGALSYFILIKKTLTVNSNSKKILSIQLVGDKALTNYLLSTLIPIVGISLESDVDKVTILIILVLLFLIFVQSNNFFFNPFLFAMGYRMYKVEVAEEGIIKKVTVLHKGELNDLDINLFYSFYPITNSVYLMTE